MADSIFSQSPVDQEIQRQIDARSPKKEPRAELERIATDTRVPVNVLMALNEAVGISGTDREVEGASAAAAKLAPRLQAGEDIEAVLTSLVGNPDATGQLLGRAREIGAELYPQQAEQDAPEQGEDQPSRISQAFTQGAAATIASSHEFARDIEASLEESAFGRAMASLQAKGDKLLGREADTRTAKERAQELRDAPMAPGYDAAQATLARLQEQGFEVTDWKDIQGIGSMVSFVGENMAASLPQMAATMTTGALSAPLTITMLGAEANSEMKERTDLTEGQRVAMATGAGTAMWALESIGLGAAFGKILPSEFVSKAVTGELADHLVKGGIKRSAARVIEAGITEGVTEVLQEGIVMAATGMAGGEYDRDEVIERLSAAFAGGAGVGGGIRTGVEAVSALKPGEQPSQNEQPEPDGGVATPPEGAQDGVSPSPPEPVAVDGPAQDATAAPRPTAPPEQAGVEAGAAVAAPEPPQGTLAKAMTKAPQPIAPDMIQGDTIDVAGQGITPFEGRFVSETPAGVIIEDDNGQRLEISRGEMESGAVQMQRKPQPAGGLADQAAQNIRPPEGQTGEDMPQDADQARARAKFIEDQAKISGWDTRLRRLHAQMTDIADQYDTADAQAMDQTANEVLEPAAQVEPEPETIPEPEPVAEPQAVPDVPEVAVEPEAVESAPEQDAAPVEAQEDTADTQTEPDDWSPLSEGDRTEILRVAGFTTKAGKLNAPGRKLLNTAWSDLKPTARGKIEQAMSAISDLAEPAPAAEAETPTKPREPATPMAPAEDRTQLDMLGGPEVPENVLAEREAARKVWGRMRGMIEGGYTKDVNESLGGFDLKGSEVNGQGSITVSRDGETIAEVFTRDGPEEAMRQINAATRQPKAKEAAPTQYKGEKKTTIDALRDAVSKRETALDKTDDAETLKATSPAVKKAKAALVKMVGPEAAEIIHDRIENELAVSKPKAATPDAEAIDAAAAEADPDPTDAQKEAENYKMGHTRWNGLDITIENAKGSIRSKSNKATGKSWSVKMPAHYGKIRGTKGADGDHVDVYIGDNPESDYVSIIDQVDLETGVFDEHKVILGAKDQAEADAIYEAGFSDGKGADRMGGFKAQTVDQFKSWLQNGDTTLPVSVKGDPVEPQAYHAGFADRMRGKPRDLPSYMRKGSNGESRYKAGWDKANSNSMAKPLEKPADFGLSPLRDGYERLTVDNGTPSTTQTRMTDDGFVVTRDINSTSIADPKGIIIRQGMPDMPESEVVETIEDARKPEIAMKLAAQVKPDPSPVSKSGTYGASNTLVSADRAAELREKLAAKLKGQLNAGIDPEILAMGAELMVFHIEAGARKFSDAIGAVANDLGTTPDKLTRFARSWYNGARDLMEDSDISIDGMDDAETVREALNALKSDPTSSSVDTPSGKEPSDAQDNPRTDANDAGSLEADSAEAVSEPIQQPEEPVDEGSNSSRADDDGRSRGGRRDDRGDAGRDTERVVDDRLSDEGSDGRVTDLPAAQENFQIPDDFELGAGTPKVKVEANLAAIRTVKALMETDRQATAEEQATMARYVGWGGLKAVFDPKNKGASSFWGKAQAEMAELLTDAEYDEARKSVRNAHYTAQGVVDAMWRSMAHLGYQGGRALEPTTGIGNFIGRTPATMETEWHGAELDILTGHMAKYIYPEAEIFPGRGFEDVPFRDGSFDIAIGNPPFGSYKIKDKTPNRAHLSGMKVHNYIIAKTAMHLRPGGVMSMVVTHRFLDTANPEARSVLAKNMKFLGAIRLPKTAFEANAGTEVVTDIVYFQKLHPGEKPDADAAWLDTDGVLKTPEGDLPVNRYFAENPQMILGKSTTAGTMYKANEYTVENDGRDLAKAIDDAVKTNMADLKDTLSDREAELESAAIAPKTTTDIPIGGMVLQPDGLIMRRDLDDADGQPQVEEVTEATFWADMAQEWAAIGSTVEQIKAAADQGQPITRDMYDQLRIVSRPAFMANGDRKSKPTSAEKGIYAIMDGLRDPNAFTWQYDKALSEITKTQDRKRLGVKGFKRLGGLLKLRNSLSDLIAAERTGSDKMENLRKKLNREYKAFQKEFGFVNDGKNLSVLKGDVGMEMGLEKSYQPTKDGRPASAEAAEIMESRVFYPYEAPQKASNASDALTVSITERGKVDMAYMVDLTGQDMQSIADELTESGQVFQDPESGEYQTADEYLSGNVRHKLRVAEENGAKEQAEALKAVQPKPLDKNRIKPTIRSQWLPSSILTDFMEDLGIVRARANIMQSVGKIVLSGSAGTPSDFGKQFNDKDADLMKLLNAATAGKSITITRSGPNNTSYKDNEASERTTALAARMAEVFEEWAYQDSDRADVIVDAFNERMNTHVQRKFDGKRYLKTVGQSAEITPRDTQVNAAWRMIQQKSVLVDHTVGAGKTITEIMAVMERVRLGLTRKELIVVPNHIVNQWAREWYELYPGARLLVATEKDFTRKNRRRLFARMATGNYDAIIIGHSSLGFIANDPKEEGDIMREKMREMKKALDEMKASGESGRTLTQIENLIEGYETKLEELAERPKDEMGLSFTDMGVDAITVDEMHEFKNLEYATSGERVKGMNDPKGSKKAFDLYVKMRGIQNRKGYTQALTGTPVSNSLVELYSMMSYLIRDELVNRNQAHFDAWSSAYAVTETRMEYTATQKVKPARVLVGLTNLSALGQLYNQFADIVTPTTIKDMYRKQKEAENKETGGSQRTDFPIPKVKSGGRKILIGKPTPSQKEYMDYGVARMDAISQNKSDKEYPKIDNPLWVLSDIRKMSIDIRAVDYDGKREEGSKVVRAGNEIKRIYDKWDDDRGTQMVFSDLSTPAKQAAANARKLLREAAATVMTTKEVTQYMKRMDEKPKIEVLANILERIESAAERATSNEKADEFEAILAQADDLETMMRTADTGFSVYDDLKAYLVELGIPENEVRFIHDANTPAQKDALIMDMNAGRVRVLIGSTPKMGAGTNAQERMVALHHIDAPWRPSDIEQREGRIVRQKNALYKRDPDGFQVEIIAYSTEGTADTVMWQTLERKAKAIEMFREAGIDEINEEGGDGDQYAEFMASTTGNPVFKQKLEAEVSLRKETARVSGDLMSQQQAKTFLARLPRQLDRFKGIAKGAGSFKAGDISWQGQTGSPDSLRTAMEEATDKYDKATFKYLQAYPKAELAREQARKAGKKGADLPKLPPKPSKPTLASKTMAEASPYVAVVRGALESLAAKTSDGGVTLKMGNADIEFTKYATSNKNEFEFTAILKIGEFKTVLAETYGSDPVGSPRLYNAVSPDRLAAQMEFEAQRANEAVNDLNKRKPEMEKTANKETDISSKENAEQRVNYLKAAVAMAEAEADTARAERPNKYIPADTKRRLAGAIAVQEIDPQDVVVDGDTFTLTGPRSRGGDFVTGEFYAAERKSDGKRAIVEGSFKETDGETGFEPKRVMLEPDNLNAKESRAPEGWGSVEPDPEITRRDLRAISARVNAEIAGAGLAGKVTGRVVRSLEEIGRNRSIRGLYQSQEQAITVRGDADAVGTARHEIIHALRDSQAWGQEYGLFTKNEWRALVREARKDKAMLENIQKRYPDLAIGNQMEELVAESYRNWSHDRDSSTQSGKVMAKISNFFTAMANVFRGEGFVSAAGVMDRIASGDIGERGPSGPGGGGRGSKERRADDASPLPVAPVTKKERGFASRMLTDAMTGTKRTGGWSALSLVPGRPLYAELGKSIRSAKIYLKLKEGMDALRQDWHAKTDETAQAWRKILSKNGKANVELMDLMHDATLAGQDPAAEFRTEKRDQDDNILRNQKGTYAADSAAARAAKDKKARAEHTALKKRFDALPPEFQDMYRRVRDQYEEMGDAFEKAILDNIEKAMSIGLKRAERTYQDEVARIKDDGLTGKAFDEAMDEAKTIRDNIVKRSGWNKNARLSALRAEFETNKIAKPYFPLMRFGEYFATIRDKDTGEVLSFSKFESEKEQQAFVKEYESDADVEVQIGTMLDNADFKEVDPSFVADVESIIGGEMQDSNVADLIWQRWLETLPDYSMRKSRIHRKGTQGYAQDAFRAFGRQMFHGSHQLARLSYGLDMNEALEEAGREAAQSDDPNRNTAIVKEMNARHEFVMNPKGSAIAQTMTTAAFVMYLSVTPSAALVNLSQTTVVGIPLLASAFKKGGVAAASRQLMRAMGDFTKGKGFAEESKRLTPDEKRAMQAAYQRGTVDRTQSHDLAGVGETGVEYSDRRAKVMEKVSFFFHHAERLNREVTFLAAYRMARDNGMSHENAVEKGADLTWKSHFDYQNTSRPRLLQNDFTRVALVFRNFQINMLWRLFRDSHQAFKGADAETRKEARSQIVGITGMMMLQAGITGTWGYALMTMLAGVFFDDGSDDVEEEIQRALVNTLGTDLAGMLLKGVPGHLSGINLTNRIGMPELWFRSSDRSLEGDDAYNYWLSETLGASVGIIENTYRGIDKILDGEVQRGVETMSPKFVRDVMQAYRYLDEGVTTYKGDPIQAEVSVRQALTKALGFQPAQISERYGANTKLKNAERRIQNERRGILKDIREDIKDGKGLSRSSTEAMQAFNFAYPSYAIDGSTIRSSYRSSLRASQNNRFGVQLNKKLERTLMDEAAPLLYN